MKEKGRIDHVGHRKKKKERNPEFENKIKIIMEKKGRCT